LLLNALTFESAGDHFTALCRIDDQQPTPGLIQLDFIVEQVVRDSFGYARTETSHEPLPLRYNAVKHTGLTDELQMAAYLDLQTVWAGLPGSTKTFYLQVARCSVRKTFWEWRHSEQNIEPVNNADVVHSLFGNHWHDYALAAEVQHEQKQVRTLT
jgi:uridine phosphorylase